MGSTADNGTLISLHRFDEDLRQQLLHHLGQFPRRAQPDGSRRRAAVAITVVPEAGEAAFVITRRAPRLRSHGGQWALPGGSVDDGETPEDGARRELHEEVALEVGPDDVLGLLDDYPTRSGYVITPVVLWCPSTEGLAPDPTEVRSAHLVPLTELARGPRFVAIPESDRPVIQLPLLDHVISAPTAAVLHQFHEVAVHGRHTRVDHFDQPVFAWE